MMACQVCLVGLVLSLHSAQSYILLTANLDDVHAIAKQIAESPVAGQLNQIIRRASNIFTDQVQKAIDNSPQQRANDKGQGGKNDDDFEIWSPSPKGKGKASSSESSDSSDEDENQMGRRNARSDALQELGKNASFYLKSIKKIFDSL